MREPCTLCGQPCTGRARRGLCRACYQYALRTGRERPEYLRRPDLPRYCCYCTLRLVKREQRRGACAACRMRIWRRTVKLRDLINKINIKSTIAAGTLLRSEPSCARLTRQTLELGVANRLDIKLGRINAN